MSLGALVRVADPPQGGVGAESGGAQLPKGLHRFTEALNYALV